VIRVGVIGAGGRMGQEVCRAVTEAEGLELVAEIDPAFADVLTLNGVMRAPSLRSVEDGSLDVLVDFTVADIDHGYLADAVTRGFHIVVGTTGLRPAELDAIAVAAEGDGANALVAPNFAIGAVLMMKFAEQAAKYFDGVEVIELHHDRKVDAPSGTALKTIDRIAAARQAAGVAEQRDPTTTMALEGARGGRGPAGIAVHSVRLPGLVAHEEILFGNPGEGLTLRHDSYDRSSFMPGVLLGIRRVGTISGLTIGLESFLED